MILFNLDGLLTCTPRIFVRPAIARFKFVARPTANKSRIREPKEFATKNLICWRGHVASIPASLWALVQNIYDRILLSHAVNPSRAIQDNTVHHTLIPSSYFQNGIFLWHHLPLCLPNPLFSWLEGLEFVGRSAQCLVDDLYWLLACSHRPSPNFILNSAD